MRTGPCVQSKRSSCCRLCFTAMTWPSRVASFRIHSAAVSPPGGTGSDGPTTIWSSKLFYLGYWILSADSWCFEAARAIFSRTHEDGWAFDVEVLAIAREYGLRVIEVPIDWHHDRNSRVRPLRDAPSMFAALFRIRARLMMGMPDIPHDEPHRPQQIFPRT